MDKVRMIKKNYRIRNISNFYGHKIRWLEVEKEIFVMEYKNWSNCRNLIRVICVNVIFWDFQDSNEIFIR